MHLTLRYFASIREAVGHGEESFETDAPTVGALRDALIARGEPYAACLARTRAVRAAVDRIMAGESQTLREGAEVAFFPPVTGG